MSNQDFFQQIKQVKVPWGDTQIPFPVFYYDVATLSVQFLASVKQVRQLLPSKRMYPFQITPWHCVVAISAFEYRASDIGAYNEVSIGIPVLLDEPSPWFMGTLNKVPKVPQVYIYQLPVTTEIARDLGVEFAGYPKFLADIHFEQDGRWVRCHLQAEGQHILTLTGQGGELKKVARSRTQPLTLQSGYLLRCEAVVSERQQSSNRIAKDVCLQLGDHQIAQELKQLKLSQVLGCQYAPQHQVILTPVIESFSA